MGIFGKIQIRKKARNSWIIARREIRDQLRDWRIITPIILMTLFFPLLMNFTARESINFVNKYGAYLIADRLLPFLMMVVGFFPISISLVIALESFAGERERKTLEPLLATPFSDEELYLGKIAASIFMPLGAAYLGTMVYLIALTAMHEWEPPAILLVQMFLLTTVQAFVMVSGAVVVSSQVTSVRGANLLASFIIVPMSQLVIGESLIMFWGQYNVLWWMVIGLVILGLLLGRMGLHSFNREALLGRELDVLDLRWAGRTFWRSFRRGGETFGHWLRSVIKETMVQLRFPALIVSVFLSVALVVGIRYAAQYPLPADLMNFDGLGSGFERQLASIGLIGGQGWLWVLWNNTRAILLSFITGVFTFGTAGILLLMAPLAILGYFIGNVSMMGQPVIPFLVGMVLPHAILEVPAILLGGAALLKAVVAGISPTDGRSIGETWILELAEWARVFIGIILPLVVVAAAVEIYITPKIALLIF
ncbi:MAG: stage II sporulation protein M [Anaerolineales bacterium]|nr:stage II sporulation protein M [Anaerolineales bacterium]